MPTQVYPLFEQALRHAAGRSVDEHLVAVSELWAGFSVVAEGNPDAWIQEPWTASENPHRGAVQPLDHLAVHQGHVLQQRGGAGRRA